MKAIIREAVLSRRIDGEPGRLPAVLYLRVVQAATGAAFEMREEDDRGNLRFVYRDTSKRAVLGEFRSAVQELLADYAVVPDG